MLIVFLILFRYNSVTNILKGNEPKYIYTLTFDNSTMTTNSQIRYLGSSSEYKYLYDLEQEGAIIFRNSKIEKIDIIKNPKYKSLK